MKKWMIIAIVVLALVLAIMNLTSWKKKKDTKNRTGTILIPADGNIPTRPPVDLSGNAFLEDMPTGVAPSTEMELLFGTGNEDMASGVVDTGTLGHTGVAIPSGFYQSM